MPTWSSGRFTARATCRSLSSLSAPMFEIWSKRVSVTKMSARVSVSFAAAEEDEEEAYDVRNGALAPFHELWRYPLVHRLVPGLEQLAGKYHWGNYVVVRATGERIFESMPIYTR